MSLSRRACVLSLPALAVSLGLVGCGDSGLQLGGSAKPKFTGVDITGVPYATGFSLPDGDGKTRTLDEFKGQVVVLFFGYTQCPDVCPTTLAELAKAKQILGEDGKRVQGIFVTVDPERDTPEVVKAYSTAFDPSFVGLRPANSDAVDAVVKEFKVVYVKAPGTTPGTYTVNHTAASLVFDAQGKPRLYEQYNVGAEALAKDLAVLLKQG